tara:strand:- start:25848 stop:27254 length:1407 start_codon:yes stop_codon:yes gene_type:complete
MAKKEICCIGAGYVGGPTMAVIALKCPEYNVTVVDINKDRIDAWNGDTKKLPVYEPGLKEIVEETREKNLFFSTNIDSAIERSEIIFMAVNTPTKEHGEGKGMATDLTYVEECSKRIAMASKSHKIIVEKSTAPIGTAEKIKETLKANNDNVDFEVISNPEFLAEGSAVNDLLDPDRVLVGANQTKSGIKAMNQIVEIYNNWIHKEKIITTNLWSSELSKLASNAFLAQRVSSINSLSSLCEESGANILEVSRAVGADSRIGNKFLEASVGFGGSCFKKDILNLVYLCQYYGLNEVAEYWHQVIKINNHQKTRFSNRIILELGGTVKNKIITLLGWAFKKDTNDSRESASIEVANYLLNQGAIINVYDPMVSSKLIYKDIEDILNVNGLDSTKIKSIINRVNVFDNIDQSINKTCCVAVLTEWDVFKTLDWDKISKFVEQPLFIADGRNIIDQKLLNNKTYKYISVGT